jgi:hypothetical protein
LVVEPGLVERRLLRTELLLLLLLLLPCRVVVLSLAMIAACASSAPPPLLQLSLPAASQVSPASPVEAGGGELELAGPTLLPLV